MGSKDFLSLLCRTGSLYVSKTMVYSSVLQALEPSTPVLLADLMTVAL